MKYVMIIFIAVVFTAFTDCTSHSVNQFSDIKSLIAD